MAFTRKLLTEIGMIFEYKKVVNFKKDDALYKLT